MPMRFKKADRPRLPNPPTAGQAKPEPLLACKEPVQPIPTSTESVGAHKALAGAANPGRLSGFN